VMSQADFNRIHFFLLGNRFETLYLPSAIVLVEGKCDHEFIERVLTLRFPTSQLSIIAGNSDTRIKEILSVAKGLLSGIQRSPYRDRIFVVLDSVHSASLPNELERMGLSRDNIVIWPKNGIEYYYPPLTLDRIFGPGPSITIQDDIVSRNGISYTKGELAGMVVAALDATTPMHAEFDNLLLDKLESLILPTTLGG
jgi:hypothetical protein